MEPIIFNCCWCRLCCCCCYNTLVVYTFHTMQLCKTYTHYVVKPIHIVCYDWCCPIWLAIDGCCCFPIGSNTCRALPLLHCIIKWRQSNSWPACKPARIQCLDSLHAPQLVLKLHDILLLEPNSQTLLRKRYFMWWLTKQ